LLEILAGDGTEVAVMEPVCVIGRAGEDISPLVKSAAARTEEKEKTGASAPVETDAPRERGSLRASPRARNLADRVGLNLADVTPTGPGGRIIARDVDARVSGRKNARFEDENAEDGRNAEISEQPADFADERMSLTRRVIADAMTSSLRNSAQLTNHHSFDASRILGLRSEFKGKGAELGLDGISIGDMVLYAVAKTLPDYPRMNAHIMGDTLRKFAAVHLGVAVDTPRGLMVPTIFNADKKSLAAISRETKALAAACRSGGISPDLLRGATFTVSNLGATGVEIFTPIINPPQVAIIGVCGLTAKARDGARGVETYPAMGLSVTYDHRAIDGAPASRFLQALCARLEQFQLLLAL
jgi:pyruvate dehydrogenase E2 component (dihydrolipoamide acetyltransferase)